MRSVFPDWGRWIATLCALSLTLAGLILWRRWRHERGVPCRSCRGTGKVFSLHGLHPAQKPHHEIACFTCRGLRFVPRDHELRCAFGARLRDIRLRTGNSLGQEARNRGVSVEAISAAERGCWFALKSASEREYFEEIYRKGTI